MAVYGDSSSSGRQWTSHYSEDIPGDADWRILEYAKILPIASPISDPCCGSSEPRRCMASHVMVFLRVDVRDTLSDGCSCYGESSCVPYP